MTFADSVPAYRRRLENHLERWLPTAEQHPQSLHQAMRYAMLNGGKRLRPLLMYATAEALHRPLESVDGAASAVEMVHAYSLIHDDLPAMDDDDLRRGRPSCHRAFDEATAILAGDALLTLAFQVLVRDRSMPASPAQRLEIIGLLADAGGSHGMAGGQAMDLAATGRSLNVAEIENMHIHKTGALIRASVLIACHAGRLPVTRDLQALDHYAKCVGLAFQIHDDILDEMGDPDTMGKTGGADRARNKPTYPSVVGMREATERARALTEEAIDSLSVLDEAADGLRWLARRSIERQR